ncbi:MAG: Ig-like domain-containing protein, partial [Tannerella sp.]|nr:Ig-like domain-containing protein [Tannerella sp.]
QLTATVLPDNATDKTVPWSSSHPDVATVSETGLVTAVSEGTATITATTQNGERTASCEVTVTVPTIPVASVTLDITEATLEVGVTQQLTATVFPENATDKTVSWSSSHPDVATVSETGLVTAVSEGTATITATSGEQSDICEVTVTDLTSLSTILSSERILEATLSDIAGRRIAVRTQPEDLLSNISGLKKGVYLLSVKYSKGTATRKIIID